MTDSEIEADLTPRGGKRDRLVASAADLLYRHGVAATSLSDIADAADVPAGNVYYYFKTKNDLIRAVIQTRTDQARAMVTALEPLAQPVERLKALVRQWDEMREPIAQYGCPFGALAVDLDRPDGGLNIDAAEPIRCIVDWTESQIRHLNSRDARQLAITLFATVQGGALLAHAMRDPSLMSSQVRYLEQWIDTLATAPPSA